MAFLRIEQLGSETLLLLRVLLPMLLSHGLQLVYELLFLLLEVGRMSLLELGDLSTMTLLLRLEL